MTFSKSDKLKIALFVPASALYIGFIVGSTYIEAPDVSPIKNAKADTLVEKEDLNSDDPEFTERREQINCLAENIYHEARSESLAGQIAVAHVTLNRVSASGFPDTICGVVKAAKLDSHGLPVRNRCAFSWYCDGVPDKIYQDEVFSEILKLSTEIVEGDRFSDDITSGATHYHNHTVSPLWAKTMVKTATIDGHVFYREKIR